MKNITIPVDVPSDLMLTLNKSEQELKSHFQSMIAILLFHEGKLTLGKAIQLSGLTRHEFEKALAGYKIPVSKIDFEQVTSDIEKLSNV